MSTRTMAAQTLFAFLLGIYMHHILVNAYYGHFRRILGRQKNTIRRADAKHIYDQIEAKHKC